MVRGCKARETNPLFSPVDFLVAYAPASHTKRFNVDAMGVIDPHGKLPAAVIFVQPSRVGVARLHLAAVV